MNAVIRLSKHI